MKKAEIKLDGFLTVVCPSSIVRIMDETQSPTGHFTDPDEITVLKGTAAKVFREVAGKGYTIRHIAPEVEKNDGRYVFHIYIHEPFQALEFGA